MTERNPYATPAGDPDLVKTRREPTTNWVDRRFLLRCLLATVASYLSAPMLWIASLTIRDLQRGADMTTLNGSFWRYVFVSKLPMLVLLGTALAFALLFRISRSHQKHSLI